MHVKKSVKKAQFVHGSIVLTVKFSARISVTFLNSNRSFRAKFKGLIQILIC